MTRRSGVTLIELIVVITAIAVITGVSALVMPRRTTPPDDTAHRIANARTKALRAGHPVSVVLQLASGASLATALPDGSVLADTGAHIERLTGRTVVQRDTSLAHSVAQ